MRVTKTLERSVFPVGLVGAAAAIVVAYSLFGLDVALRGIYPLIGLLIGAILYYATDIDAPKRAKRPAVRWYGKTVFCLVGLGIAIVGFTGGRLLVLLTLLPAGYFLLLVQMRTDARPAWLLPQLLALFALPPMTKYAATGLYFGNGDIPRHVRSVDLLLEHGWTGAIAYETYDLFPGYHLLAGSTSLVTGMDPYHAILQTGILTYAIGVIPLLYLTARMIDTDRQLPVAVAFAGTVLFPFSFYSTYFFPQALAIPLGLFGLYATVRVRWHANAFSWLLVSVTLFATLTVTHHFSVVLFVPFVVLLMVAGSFLDYVTPSRFGKSEIVTPRADFLLVDFSMPIAYWILVASSFFAVLVWGVREVLVKPIFVGGTSAQGGVVVLGGATVKTDLAATLHPPELVYYLCLTTVFALGLVYALNRYRRYRPLAPLAVVGALTAAIMFKTPFAPNSILRFRHAAGFFFAFVLGFGVYRLLRTRPAVRFGSALPAVVLLVLSITAPVVAADDVYRLHSGYQSQQEFSDEEFQQLRATSQFIETHDPSVTTLWATRRGLQLFDVTATGRVTMTEGGVRLPPGAFLYRENWADHRVVFGGESVYLNVLLLSERWLSDAVDSDNKIYDAGGIGMTWGGSERRLEGGAPASQPREST